MAIDTAEILGLKMKPSKDSFTFVDSTRVNSAGMIKNVKVEIGELIIPVDFDSMDIKSGKTSPLLFGRAFMATVWAVCDLKRNKMCLTNVDETVFYDPMEKKKSEELISCIEMFEYPGPTADSHHEPAIPESASVDIRIFSIGRLPVLRIDRQSDISVGRLSVVRLDRHEAFSIGRQPPTFRTAETEKSKSGRKDQE
uniref:Uncharacterized protein n=1 Tax=Brassica campestris TaxID=3711 RepID=M4FCV2_BRACM